jgi:hypothetical protein
VLLPRVFRTVRRRSLPLHVSTGMPAPSHPGDPVDEVTDGTLDDRPCLLCFRITYIWDEVENVRCSEYMVSSAHCTAWLAMLRARRRDLYPRPYERGRGHHGGAAGPALLGLRGYVAPGHIHKAQEVGGRPWVRYCGSIDRLDAGEWYGATPTRRHPLEGVWRSGCATTP